MAALSLADKGEGCTELPPDPNGRTQEHLPALGGAWGEAMESAAMRDTQDDLLGNASQGETAVGGPGTSGESG